MVQQEKVLNKIAEGLLLDYTSVYYVDAETNEYFCYTSDPDYRSLKLDQSGDNFFESIIQDIETAVYREDRQMLLDMLQKDKLMDTMKRGEIKSVEYRLLINGFPVWHLLRIIRALDEESDYFLLGIININEEYSLKQEEEELNRQRNIYRQVATSLAEQYDTLYYIDLDTDKYFEISSTDEYKKLNVPATGKDFFSESRRSIRKYVHPDDMDEILHYHYKDAMLANLKFRNSFSVSYKLVVNGEVKHVRHTEILSKDKTHIIVCIENIDSEIKAKLEHETGEIKDNTYTQIAESLASHYDLIYYVDSMTEHYMEFSAHKIYGELEIQEEGDNFFEISHINADKIIYQEDRERIKLFLDKDNLISQLDNSRQLVMDYRMVIEDSRPRYTRMTVTWSSDKSHFIICIENREEDVKKEKEHLRALSMANDIARRDDLTGTRNKTAYHEMEKELEKIVEEKQQNSFGIIICDINDLKMVNDTQGHKLGDELIKNSCKMICRIFSHSPVFRIGGDEFVVVLKDQDFNNREELISNLKGQVEDHINLGEGPIVAVGMAEFQPYKDSSVEDVFNRADSNMYENKNLLKEQQLLKESKSMKEVASFRVITAERRKLLEGLYKSFRVVAEGTYVYICDMKYDFSIWPKNAVDR